VGSEHIDAALRALADTPLVPFSHDGRSVLMHHLVARVLRDRACRRGRRYTSFTDTLEFLTRLHVLHDKKWRRRQIAAEVINHIDTLANALNRDFSKRFDYHPQLTERITQLRATPTARYHPALTRSAL